MTTKRTKPTTKKKELQSKEFELPTSNHFHPEESFPGKAVAGIEIPNRVRGIVRIDEVLDSPASILRRSPTY
jgi:DNA segregation ATPase FtsK/SpoIIIE-like protein